MDRPNILMVMVDQLTGLVFRDGPAGFLHAPNLARLAERSVRFTNCYTPSPLCAPARASLVTGQMPSRHGVYDNAAELPANIPTSAHYLRRAGYQTGLIGKMHFCGPDQLHGFEDRPMTDIYPADFGWTPDYRKPGERINWWYHNMGSVTGAGVAEITNQLEFDDAVTYHATRKIRDLARGHDERPWFLTVSFTHPHDPYVARRQYWDLYENCDHLLPTVAALPEAEHDPHGRRILAANDAGNFTITEDHIRRARRAYFANISYLDEQIGRILKALQNTRQEAVILFLSDHGDMLGERGLWFKMSFHEGSARIPLMIALPGQAPGRIEAPVSAVDLTPTLCELVGVDPGDYRPWSDGESLLPLLAGGERVTPVAMEYAAEASQAPMVSLRQGQWKFNRCRIDPDQLFDLQSDPHERTNLAADPAHGEVLARFSAMADARWDLDRFDQAVRDSQARRWIVYDALRQGRHHSWEHQPVDDAANRFMRNHMDLNRVEEDQRFPRGE